VIRLEPINYTYLDGLRGIGAFIVYLSHFMDQFFPLMSKKEIEEDPEVAKQ
jgi:peptidoglycan/LPS O-acetylase OafA/YrhL